MNNNTRKKITIIGLGPMGQAMAKVFVSHGYETTVWNRTKRKAEELAKSEKFIMIQKKWGQSVIFKV